MRYYNETLDKWYMEGESITLHLSDDTLLSGIPTAEQLADCGYLPYVEPEHEETNEERLARAKENKIWEIEHYDSSSAVNGFDISLGGQTITAWLTPDQRANYKNSIDAAELLELEEVHPVFGGQQLTIPTATAKMALAQIQLYADRCFIVTETHKAAVMTLESEEEVIAYEHTEGYPEKLTFTL